MSEKKKGVVPRLRFPEFRNAGPWEVKRLGAVARLINERVDDKDYVLLSVTSGVGLVPQKEKFGREIAGKQKKNYWVIRRFDFAYNKSATKEYPQGYVALYTGNKPAGVPNSIFTCFRPDLDLVAPNYLNHLFSANFHGRWLAKVITVGARAHGSLNVDSSDVLNIPLPIPKVAEQQKIADCLSSLDELIQLQAQKLDTLKAHKKGLMQQLFPREGETTPRLRFPEFRNAGPWEVKRLGEVCEVLQGYAFPNRFQGKRQGKYPFCKVSDITKAVAENGGHIRGATNYIDDEELPMLRARPVPIGTTIFARIGEALRLNNRAITDVACLIDNNVGGIKAKENKAVDVFVFYMAQGIDLNEHCGGAVPSVNKTTLEFIKVTIPKQPEQQKIADCLSSLDELIQLEAQKLDALKAHKKGLMQQLFPQEVE